MCLLQVRTITHSEVNLSQHPGNALKMFIEMVSGASVFKIVLDVYISPAVCCAKYHACLETALYPCFRSGDTGGTGIYSVVGHRNFICPVVHKTWVFPDESPMLFKCVT